MDTQQYYHIFCLGTAAHLCADNNLTKYEALHQSLLETVRKNPMPKVADEFLLKQHTKSLYKKASTKARQKQILDYRKKSLTLKKK